MFGGAGVPGRGPAGPGAGVAAPPPASAVDHWPLRPLGPQRHLEGGLVGAQILRWGKVKRGIGDKPEGKTPGKVPAFSKQGVEAVGNCKTGQLVTGCCLGLRTGGMVPRCENRRATGEVTKGRCTVENPSGRHPHPQNPLPLALTVDVLPLVLLGLDSAWWAGCQRPLTTVSCPASLRPWLTPSTAAHHSQAPGCQP